MAKAKFSRTKGQLYGGLATIFVVVFLFGFVFIAYVDSNWAETSTEEVYSSNDSAEIPFYPMDVRSSWPYSYKGNFTTGQRIETGPSTPKKYFLNDSTALYNGNNTWIATFQDTGTLSTVNNWITSPFTLKNADTYLMKNISYSIFHGIGQIPDSLTIWVAVYEIDGEIDIDVNDDGANPDDDKVFIEVLTVITPTTTWSNGTLEISLVDSLDIYQQSQQPNTETFLIFQSQDNNGWGTHLKSWSFKINGTYQKGISTLTVVNYTKLGAGIMIWFVGLVATDTIDLPMPKPRGKGVKK